MAFGSLIIWAGGILLVVVIAFGITFAIYSNKVKNDSRVSTLNSGKIAELVPSIQTEEISQDVSSQIGKTVEEMKNEVEANTENLQNIQNTTNESTNSTAENKVTENKIVENVAPKEEIKKELTFKMPVQGEILREFAKDNLVYSETLKEWITHLGIDIASEKTSVVKASEEGTVKAIKNDPRYGLTVIIEHSNGYKTIYSNLFTAEFIVEGEKVSQGQTIGTIGTTAVFEVADEPHLHFELLKDDEYLDPMIYLK